MKETFIKWCDKHGNTEHAFYGGRLKCKQCMVEYDKEKRHRIKQKLVEYKGGKCEICGYNKCLNALDFHHKNKNEKLFTSNSCNYNKSFDILKQESDKCVLLCSNCHRELHYEENENRRQRLLTNHVNEKCSDKKIIDKLVYKDILNDYQNGLFQQEIAEKYNVSISTIKRFMNKHNIFRKRIEISKDEILEICKECASISHISKKTNHTYKSIKNYLVKNNLIDDINKIREEQGLKKISNKMLFK